MSDVRLRSIGDIGAYEGEKAIAGIAFRHAGKDLGVTAWGMNVLEIEAGCEDYPEHDHAEDGQEEVYVILRGGGKLRAGDETHELETGTLVRVGPKVRRKWLAGDAGLTLLAIGATPPEA